MSEDARFLAAFRSSPGAIGISDLSQGGRLLDVNESWEKLTGYTRVEALGRSTVELNIVSPHTFGLFRQRLQTDGRIREFEFQFRRKDGSTGTGLLSSELLTLEGKHCAVTTTIDISERKKAEESLRGSEIRFRTIFDLVPFPLSICDLEGRILDVNAVYCQRCGCTSEELKGHFLSEVMEVRYPESKESETVPVLEYLRAALRSPVELVTHPLAGGSRHHVLISAVRLTLNGKPCLATCAADITELRQVEREYRHAQKMEAVGRLAGGVAHDFNNLLTVINGYSDLALKQLPAQDPLRPAIGEIRKAGERAAGLSRQLLTLSRKQVVEPRPIDISKMIRDSRGMLERLVGEDVKISEELSAVGMVKADPDQMNQILMNLVVNARDAMPEGGRIALRVLRLELEQAPACAFLSVKAGPHVVLEVSDTGVGMSQEIQAKIFEPFFTTKNERGTGLGLATVYGIVHQAGGWIAVESSPGQGTTFRIGFPVVAESPAEVGTPEAPVAQPQGAETVLVVEDRAEVRKLAIVSLRSFGYRTLEARSGEEALHLAQNYPGPIHLLLADVIMPEMNGRQLADRLQAIIPGTKVLFMSGYAGERVLRHGLLAPGMEYLQKPFTPEILAQRVRKLLGEPRAGAKILVVDGEEEIRTFLAAVLQAGGYKVVTARDRGAAQDAAKKERFDIMIAEVGVWRSGDTELIPALRRHCSGLKVIAISGVQGGPDHQLWQDLGADLALQKPISPDLLQAAVRDLLARE